MQYYAVITSNEIYHHGIKGQKWGVRRFQNKDGSLTRLGKERQDDKNDRHLTDKQKTAMKIGAVAVGSALVVVGGVALYKSGKLDGLIKIGHNAVNNLNIGSGSAQIDGIKFNPDHIHNAQIDISDINPNLNPSGPINHMMLADDGIPLASANCQACTLAYELRSRGYDTISRLVDTRKLSDEYVATKVYANPQIHKESFKNWSDFERSLLKMGEGARGNIKMQTTSGAHSVAFEIINGKLGIMDTQSGKAFPFSELLMSNGYKASKDIMFYRTDNLELNDLSFISKLVSGRS